MVDSDQFDRFEEVFQNALNSDAPASESWDAPGDHIWDDMADKIHVRKRPNRVPFLIPLILGIFITGNFVYEHNSPEGENVFSAIFKNTKKIKALDESLYATANIQDDTIDEATRRVRTSAHDFWKRSSVVQSGIMLFVRDDRNALLVDPYNFYSPYQTSKSFFNQGNKMTSFSMIESIPDIKATSLDFNSSYQKLGKVYNQPLASFENIPISTVLSQTAGETTVFSNRKNDKILTLKNIGLAGSGFASSSNLNSAYRNSLADFGFSFQNDRSFSFGGKAEFALTKKLSFETGLTYSELNSSSSHSSSVMYDPSLEFRPGPNGSGTVTVPTSNFDVTLSTPYGQVESNIVLARNDVGGSSALPGQLQEVPLQLGTAQNFKHLSIPLNLKFAALEKNNFAISPIFGATTNVLIAEKTNISSIDLPEQSNNPISPNAGQFSPYGSSVNSDLIGANTVNFDLLVGMDLQLPISGSKELEITPFYSQGLNPSFESNDFSSTNSTLGVSLGLNFKK